MNKQIITFSADEQKLVKTGGINCYASNIVSYIEAHFALGQNWSGYDSVRAVWSNDNNMTVISTVLDSNGHCVVPFEVLKTMGVVKVNLVGSISVSGTLTDRLTTFPCEALTVARKAKIGGSETTPITPSQFEQFVTIVQDAVASIKDIVSTTLNADYTLTFVYSDGTSYTTPSIRGERGPQGADGADGTDGNGIASAVLNSNYTLTLTFTDGTSYTTPSIRGAQGPKGDPGEVSQAQLDAAVTDLKSEISSYEDGVFEIGDAIVPSMSADGYKIATTGSAADSSKRTQAFAISDKPIYIKTQDGYQYRGTISASTMISTSMGAFEGWVYPRSGANYVAISFDKTATTYGAFESERVADILDEKIDTTNKMFELAGNSLQAFDKDSCVLANDIYLNISDQLISFSGCLIITSEINAHANDVVTYKCFKESIYSSSIFLAMTPFVSDVLPSVGAEVLQSERTTINPALMRGFMKLNADAKYFNLMIRFDTTAHRDAYKADVVDNLVVKIGSQNQDYPPRYTPYVFDVSESAKQTYWSGKKIWWCGTSIPAGKDQAIGSESTGLSYPEYIGELLNATVYNEALGSSMCRANVRTGNYVNALSHNIIYSLTQTTEEKQYLIDNWSTIRTVLNDPNTYASLSEVASDVLGASFEARLTPYLNGTKPMPDLFVIDHGHNDWKPYYTMPDGTTPDTDMQPTPGKITANILAEDTYMTANNNAKLVSFFGEVNKIPSSQLDGFIASVNRNCFIGAVNFLCTYILSKNPRARIVFIGNLDNWQKPQVQTAQETLSKEWEFPLVKMWEYSGFSWHYIPNTYNLWNPSGTTDLTMKQIYCKDSVHPHSDTEGITIPMYANTIANALKNIV